MINLAGRDILHGWGRFAFTGIGLGLLIGVTLSMAGIYRGMVDDGRVLFDAIDVPPGRQQSFEITYTLPDSGRGTASASDLFAGSEMSRNFSLRVEE